MGLPKIKKPSELREHLYGTLDKVCEGEKYIIPTKNGDVVLIQKEEYDLLVDDLELLKEFDGPVDPGELIDHHLVWERIEKKFGFGITKKSDENKMDKKSRKQPR